MKFLHVIVDARYVVGCELMVKIHNKDVYWNGKERSGNVQKLLYNRNSRFLMLHSIHLHTAKIHWKRKTQTAIRSNIICTVIGCKIQLYQNNIIYFVYCFLSYNNFCTITRLHVKIYVLYEQNAFLSNINRILLYVSLEHISLHPSIKFLALVLSIKMSCQRVWFTCSDNNLICRRLGQDIK